MLDQAVRNFTKIEDLNSPSPLQKALFFQTNKGCPVSTYSHSYIIAMKELTNTMYGNTMKSPQIPGYNIVRFKIGCLSSSSVYVNLATNPSRL